ncbi:hypothetical protein [Rhabdothermincola sediminis]|uniref:hypothetical protein n=1 Tax=Rhabdothermincola sediminis TaxID=2751370 RepID=UPI001AA09C8B|nr:hypothetical protein [Rhabdothermincola sediminis]
MTNPDIKQEMLLTLTDDEVIALAALSSMPWPGGAPTVEADEESVSFAVFRGCRSLIARGYDPGALSDVPELAIAWEALAAPARITLYLGDDEYRRATWGFASVHHRSETSWIIETVNVIGVHRFARATAADNRQFLESLIKAARRHAPTPEREDDTPVWLCALASGPTGKTLVAARRDEVVRCSVDLDHGIVNVLSSLDACEITEAIEVLLAASNGKRPSE